VRPWTLAHLEALAPLFYRAVGLFKAAGLRLEDLEADPMKVIATIAPIVGEVVATTLGITIEEARALRGDRATEIVMAIALQNLAYIRKIFGSAIELTRAMAATEAQTTRPSSEPSNT